MEPITKFSGKVLPLPISDVDTDQIIPARFLKTIDKQGLGKSLFNDWRYLPSGEPNPEFVLNKSERAAATILVAGDNFGCGSSREHAPWALLDFGIRAVVSTEIADIFRNNSLKNGLVPVIVGADDHRWLIEHPGAEVTIDLESNTIKFPDGRRVGFPIDGFSRYCLMQGLDQLGFLTENDAAIGEFERRSA